MDNNINKQKCILVTGAAGFIGSTLSKALVKKGINVYGIDNMNSSYEAKLKFDRLEDIKKTVNMTGNDCFNFSELDICDYKQLTNVFNSTKPSHVVNLAARAGVRMSLEDPFPYIETNVAGFTNILEACKKYPVEHLVYASSSSVYGANTKMPFSENEAADHPLSLYAATKRANELISHSYSHLYQIPTTGLRFFTVYGPWGRPDMALFLFAKSIMTNKAIKIFNNGEHQRDFTYVDDIVDGILRVIFSPATRDNSWDSDTPLFDSSQAPWRIYNIGNNKPVKLLDYVNSLEKHLEKKANIELLPMQPGDVPATWANIDKLSNEHGYDPKTTIDEGVKRFVSWFKEYYNL